MTVATERNSSKSSMSKKSEKEKRMLDRNKNKLAGDFKSFLKDYDDGEVDLEAISADWKEDADEKDFYNYDAENEANSAAVKTSSSSSLHSSASTSSSTAASRTKFMFAFSVIFHSVFIEAPLCAAESIARAFVVLVVGATSSLLQATGFQASKEKDHGFFIYFIEFLKCLAAAVSFLIPCLILQVYKEVFSMICTCPSTASSPLSSSGVSARGDDEDILEEWSVRPILTLVGWVDCRRYFTITSMSGSYSRNIADFKEGNSKNRSYDSIRADHFVLFPKFVYKKISSVLREKD
jgi:hypothetical protein